MHIVIIILCKLHIAVLADAKIIDTKSDKIFCSVNLIYFEQNRSKIGLVSPREGRKHYFEK
jgi:hypothetical protein